MPRLLPFTMRLQMAAPEAIRHEQLNGVDHLVVPVIALVEGVIQAANADTPELALAQEFASVPEAWNGRPVTLGHPQRNGQMVSANIPDVVENEQIGITFNAHRDGDKLKMEAWINLERIELLGLQDEIARIEAGEEVEISSGFFAEIQSGSGVHDGDRFDGIQRDIKPDHLAILPEGVTGACSWEDGCGAPRINKKGEEAMPNLKISKGTGCGCETETKLTAEIGSDAIVKIPLDKITKMLNRALSYFRSSERSDADIRAAIEAQVALENSNSEGFFFLIAVFDDHFIFEKNFNDQFRRSFAINDDGSVSLGDEITPVRLETDFVDVRANMEKNVMDELEQKVTALIANSATKFTEDDTSWLKSLSTEQLDSMEPVAPTADADEKDEETEATSDETVVVPEAKAEAEPTPVTMESYLESAPAPIREVLNEGLRLQESQKAELVSAIKANERNKFSTEQLEKKKVPELEQLVALMGEKVDFSGRGAPRALEQNAQDTGFADTPELLFPIEKEA